MFRKIIFIMLVFAFSNKAQAVIVQSLSIDALIQKSESVFIAKVLNVSKNKKDAEGLEYNLIQLKVIKGYKNSTNNRVIEIKQVSQKQSHSWKYLGLLPIPNYKVGETLLFFMSEKSSKGYQMPIGFDQGQLKIDPRYSKNIAQAPIALKGKNKNLFKVKTHTSGSKSSSNALQYSSKVKSNAFTVKDFEDLFKEVHRE